MNLKSITVAGVVVAIAGSAAAQPSFTPLGDLAGGVFESGAFAISGDGKVVTGYGSMADGDHAFRWTQATGMVDLGQIPGGTGSFGSGINTDGSVIVGSGISPLGREAFRWTQATGIVGLGDLPGGAFRAYGQDVSSDGLIVVGQGDYDFTPTGPTAGQAFRWTQATGMVGLGDLPGGMFYSVAFGISADGSVTVGTGHTDAGYQAVRWTPGGITSLGPPPAGGDSTALGVSADGKVIVGWAGDFAMRWTQATGMVSLGNLPGSVPGSWSVAWSATADGSVIVGAANGATVDIGFNEVAEAFIWTPARGMRRVRDVLSNDLGLGSQLEGWTLQIATGISDDGKVLTGWGYNPAGNPEAWVARLGTAACPADFNKDGKLDIQDFTAFQNGFSLGCP